MKRLLLFALLGLLLLPESATAQKRRRATPITMGLTFGVKAGAAFTNVAGGTGKSGAFTRSYDLRVNPVGGALVNYRFTPELSIQAEALYAPRGTDIQEELGAKRQKIEFKIGYVDIPLLIKYNAKIFYVEAGGVASLMTNAKQDFEIDQQDGPIADVNPLDIGYALGLGIEMPQGGFFGVRYVRGIGALGKGGSALMRDELLENTAIQLTGGFIFNHSSSRRSKRR